MVTKFGGNTPDDFNGTKKFDKLWGNEGNDFLKGFADDDKLFGGTGQDLIDGGSGNDELWGGDRGTPDNGQDTFIFKKGSGKDIIHDFDVKKDLLSIQKGLNGIQKAKDLIKLKLVSEKDGNTVINLGDGNKITLKGVSLEDFKKDINKHVIIGQ